MYHHIYIAQLYIHKYIYILHKLKHLDNLQSCLPEATRDMAREGAFLVDGSDGNFFLPYRWVHENFRGK